MTALAAAPSPKPTPTPGPNTRIYRWPDHLTPSNAPSAGPTPPLGKPTPAPRTPFARPVPTAPKATPTPRPTPRPTPTPNWPQSITLYADETRMSTGPALGLEPVTLPIVNNYAGSDGCWLAVLSRRRSGGIYLAAPDAWVHGLVRVQGGYDDDGFAKPKGYKGTAKKLAAEPAFVRVVREAFPAADDGWPGGETFLFTPLLEP